MKNRKTEKQQRRDIYIETETVARCRQVWVIFYQLAHGRISITGAALMSVTTMPFDGEWCAFFWNMAHVHDLTLTPLTPSEVLMCLRVRLLVLIACPWPSMPVAGNWGSRYHYVLKLALLRSASVFVFLRWLFGGKGALPRIFFLVTCALISPLLRLLLFPFPRFTTGCDLDTNSVFKFCQVVCLHYHWR